MDKEVIRMGSLGPRGTWFRLLDERSSRGKAVTRVHDPMGGLNGIRCPLPVVCRARGRYAL